MTSLFSASVIIPTYRRRDMVRQLLQALATQTLPADDYEVIVSIDGSEDGTRELVALFPAPYALRFAWQPNRGRAAACNTGIRMALGELIILLDDDMEPPPDFLRAHLHAHAGATRLGVIGAVPIVLDHASPPVVGYIGSKFNDHLAKLAQPSYALQLRDFYSGNFSIRRDVLLEAGLFDEAFKVYGNEDLELSLRLSRAGVQLVYSPDALAYQHYTKDFAGLARDTLSKGSTAVLLASKHPDIAQNLKLSTYRQASRKWRLLRGLLLLLSRVWTRAPGAVIRAIQYLERRHPARMRLYYQLALDYFFWLGARAAQRQHASSTQEPGVPVPARDYRP